jgi:hypothetical protein
MPGKALLTGEIYLTRSTPAKLDGRVEAPDAEAATEAAAKEFGADPKRRRDKKKRGQMTDPKERLTKVLTVAIHPKTMPGEALAAFHRARDLAKANPSLLHSPSTSPQPQNARSPREATLDVTISSLHPDWTLIIVEQLSRRAYELDLLYKISFDFTQPLAALKMVCQGSEGATRDFEAHMTRVVHYVNNKLKQSR